MPGHPGTLPLRLYRGDTYAWQVRVWTDEAHSAPMNLAGASAAAQIGGSGGVMELTCAITLPNIIDLTLAAASWNGTLAFERWDLQLSWDDGRVYTLLAGSVAVQDDVTP